MEVSRVMDLCVEVAITTSDNGIGGPFGASIVRDRDGEIICVSTNTVLRDNDPTAHAEINAIRQACRILGVHDLTGYTLVCTGYPCPMCMSAIIWSNIKTVIYGANLRDAELIGFRDDRIYDFIKSSCANNEILRLKWAGAEDRKNVKYLYENYQINQREMY